MKKIYALISLCLITFFTQGQGSWTALTSCPGSARYRAVAFEINGKCYMGTGSTGSNNNLKDFWEYDVTMDTWSQKADLTGSKRINATATSTNGYGYVGLGVDGTTFMNDWWQYDPTGNSWVSKSSFPGISRYGAGSFSINSRIYAGGGLDSAGNPLSDFYAYDPVNDVWAQKAPLLTGVAAMSIFTINQKGYFVGGVINNFTTCVDLTAEYNPTNDTWTAKSVYPSGNIFSAIGFSLDGYGYAGTGYNGTLTDSMFRYNPVNDDWAVETNWPTGIRQWAVSCVSGNRAFVGTGNSTGGQLFADWREFNSIFTDVKNLNDHSDFNVQYNSIEKEIVVRNNDRGRIKIYDMQGKLIFDAQTNAISQNFPWNRTGVFVVEFVSGKKISTTKFACNY